MQSDGIALIDIDIVKFNFALGKCTWASRCSLNISSSRVRKVAGAKNRRRKVKLNMRLEKE